VAVSEQSEALARAQLAELAARYGDIIDSRDWESLRQIFTSAVAFDVSDIGDGVIVGLDQLMRYMAGPVQHPLAHLITNVYVPQLGIDSAVMSSRLLAVQHDGTVAVGAYRDEVMLTAGGWRISNRVFSYTRRARPDHRS
jgi:SnoaL-like domain